MPLGDFRTKYPLGEGFFFLFLSTILFWDRIHTKKKNDSPLHLCGTRWLHREQVHMRQVFSGRGVWDIRDHIYIAIRAIDILPPDEVEMVVNYTKTFH